MSDLKVAFKISLPILIGYLMLGGAFGILLGDAGFSVLWSIAMAVFIYAGAMQFVAVGLLSMGASLTSVFILALVVNARQILYAMAMFKDFSAFPLKTKLYMFFSLTDETFALLSINSSISQRAKFFLALLNHIYWILGCIIGSLIGDKFSIKGIEFVLSAVFVVILLEQIKTSKSYFGASLGIVVALICLAIFGKESFLVPSMVAIIVLLFALKALRFKPLRD
ncbi:AzlC family ABC transporter permease [Helicobacter sp. 11S02629-2]|uniref:AzlC family ABC transporter permease n=1 Tax=Helicobacter sp. 11S02629-2 TaxID=1476195 RepID=UPI000BA65A91|nr:AzlC family ABC transporter permease [Helicobacter sp. 11S02629-2]PAF45601.1 hypothetical protein BKH40_01595 [Helicobacter sp. 11S02629-2]